MKYLSCFLLLALTSCTSGIQRKDFDTGSYQSSGVEQFFLPELPQWANFSASGSCFHKTPLAYMNFPKIYETYQLTYAQMIELQAQYNERLENYYRSAAIRFLKPVEQASFFSNTLEQVRAGIKSLNLPEVKEIDIIWLEGSKLEDLHKMLKSGKFSVRVPILFSSCHTRQALGQWVSENGLEDAGFYLLTAEWLAPFNSQSVMAPGQFINLAEVFGKQINFKFISTLNKQTTELVFP